jgi:hypothetical protein
MANHADADLILKLYDMRREPVMREARKTWLALWPATVDEAKLICSDVTRDDNAYVRQVTSYWEMAFSLVNQGAIDAELFARNCGEGILSCIKCQTLVKKFPEVWTRRMPEAESFISTNATAAAKAATMRQRYADK